MLPRADAAGLRPVLSVEALLPNTPLNDPRQAAIGRLMQIAIGTQLPAQVLSAMDDGTFLVRIADAQARMALPPETKAGEMLNLTLAAKTPRLTFQLQQDGSGAPAQLSTAGRLIDRLLQAISAAGGSAPLQTSRPLLDQPPSSLQAAAGNTSAATNAATAAASLQASSPDAAKLATALRDAVSTSGLFYESHLRQWADGQRPIQGVLNEPQASIGRFFQPDADPKQPVDVRHQQMAALLGNQLDTFEQQRIAWRGEAWPGLPMDWVIEREQQQKKSAGTSQQEAVWQSSIRVDMPKLGAISATIQLVGDRVQMHFRTNDPLTEQALRNASLSLVDALDAAGSRLEMMSVKRDD